MHYFIQQLNMDRSKSKMIFPLKILGLNSPIMSTNRAKYLQIIPATFSQFFLVGQKTKQDCDGITSVTKATIWSGSIFFKLLEYFQIRREWFQEIMDQHSCTQQRIKLHNRPCGTQIFINVLAADNGGV